MSSYKETPKQNGTWELVDSILQLSSLLSIMEGYVDSHNQIPEMLHLNVVIEKMQAIVSELEKEYDKAKCLQKTI